MRAHLTILTGAAALSVALSACSVNPAAAVCNGIPVQTGPIPQLIYPVPGYGPVPDDSTFIVVAYPGNPSLAQTITLAEKNGSTVSLGPMGAAPHVIPTPHAKVLPGQGTEYGVTLPALAANTTYSVNYQYENTATLCGQSTTTSVLMGTFHTK